MEDDTGRPWFKIVGGSILALAVLGVGAAVALTIYAPVDMVRDRVAAEVKARTGRDLVIGGKPSISFFPQLAVSLANVSLSNPPGMAGEPLVTMPRMDATIQLWPLLSKQVLIDQLVLQNPRVTLAVDGQGRRNWTFAAAPTTPIRFAKSGPLSLDDLPEELRDFARGASDNRHTARAPAAGGVSLGRLRIVDGSLHYADARSGVAEQARSIDLTVVAPDAAGPVQATGTLTWRGEVLRLDTRMMPMQALVTGAPVQASLAITAAPLTASYVGTFAPQRADGAFKADGQVSFKAASLSRAGAWLGRPVVGDLAQGAASVKGRLGIDGRRASISDAQVSLGTMTAAGALTVDETGPRPKITGQVRLSELNIDSLSRLRLIEDIARVRPAPTAAPAATGAAPRTPQSIEDLLREAPPAKPQVRGFLERDGWSEAPLDLSMLGHLDADVKVGFGRLLNAGLQTGPGQATVHLANRSARVVLDDLALYEGRAKGVVAVDTSQVRPQMSANVTLDGVAFGALLKDTGNDGFDGKGRLSLAVIGTGVHARQVVDSLSGKAELLVPKGSATGFDVGGMVRGLALGRIPKAERDPAARTEFTDLGASFTIAKGVADNRDFRVATRDVKAIGSGQIALGARTIDFTLRPKLTQPIQTPAGAGGPGINIASLDIPIRITGPLDRPVIGADLGQALADPSKVIDAVKQLDKREVEQTVKGLLNGEPESKAKAKEFLNNLLKR